MKNNIALLLALLLAFVCVGCSPTDPLLDDLYTLSIYPSANETYNLGDADSTWLEGWFNDIYAVSVNGTEGHFEALYINGVEAQSSGYGEFYITAALATTCTLADTYYKVSGTTSADELRFFTHTNERLTYTGTGTRVCLVSAAISVRSDTNNVVLSTKIYDTGVGHDASLIQRKIATAGDVGALALVALLTLSTNDYVEIYISSDKPGVEITFECMTLTVSTLD